MMRREPPELSFEHDGAKDCDIARDLDGASCLTRDAMVLAVSRDQVHFELIALPSCGNCPGGMFCPSSKLRAAQTLTLDREGASHWKPGDRAQLQIRAQFASPLAWKLFGWPLLGVLCTAALLGVIVPGRYQDFAIMVVAPLAAVMALWAARSSLAGHALVINAVAIRDTAGLSPGA